MGSEVRAEADENDRGQTVNLNFILKAVGRHWRIVNNQSRAVQKDHLGHLYVEWIERCKRGESVK